MKKFILTGLLFLGLVQFASANSTIRNWLWRVPYIASEFRIYTGTTNYMYEDSVGTLHYTSGVNFSSGTATYVDLVTDYFTVNSTSSFAGAITGTEIILSTVSAVNSGGLWLVDDGNNGIFIEDGGFVGIGTTNPGKPLHVYNTGDINNYIKLEGTTDDECSIQYSNNARTFSVGVRDITSGNDCYFIYDNDAPANRFVINTDGNVGIGTTDPAFKLDVNGTINAINTAYPVLMFTRTTALTGGAFDTNNGIASSMNLKTTSTGDITDGFGGGIVFNIKDAVGSDNAIARLYARRDGGDTEGSVQIMAGTSGAEPFLIIRADGNVGIGTTDPSVKLDVAGAIQASTTVYAPIGDFDTIYVSSIIGNSPVYFQDNIDMASNNIVTSGNVDGRDISADGTLLDNVVISTGSLQTELNNLESGVATDTTTLQGNITTLDGEVLKKDGSVALTSDWNVGAYDITNIANIETSSITINNQSTFDGLVKFTNIIVATGTHGSGVTLTESGAATKMIWYPKKSAFRAGATDGSDWNENAIGEYSTAFGRNNIANGKYGFAIGYNTTASEFYSTAMGYNTTASGKNTTAVGTNTTAQAFGSTVLGQYNEISGTTGSWITTEPVFVVGIGTGTTSRVNAMTILKNGNIGIGISSPIAKLHLENDGMIISSGTFGSGATESNMGAGARMIWYPRKAAFRAGSVDSTQWDDTNIGTYSSAFGSNTTADGNYSMAMGIGADAGGVVSFSFGNGTDASNNNAVAMGKWTTASGASSTSIGESTEASGAQSTAMGEFTVASGIRSTAIGYYSTSQAYASVVIGQYNKIGGTTGSWVSSDPLFVIGNGADGANRTNAMTVLKNGNVGISTSTPTEVLDVKGNIKSSYGIIAATGTFSGNISADTILISSLNITDASPKIVMDLSGATDMELRGINNGGNSEFGIYQYLTGTGYGYSMYINRAGNVGIGTTTPSHELDVRGDIVLGESGTSQDIITYDVTHSTQPYKIEVINGVLTATKI